MVRKSSIVVALLLVYMIDAFAQGPSTFEFIENKGQWDRQIKFRGEIPTGNFYLNKNGFSVTQHNADDLARFYDDHAPHIQAGKASKRNLNTTAGVNTPDSLFTIRSHMYRVQFLGGAENPEIVPDKVQSTYNNYFIGKDPSKWATNVKIYQAVIYRNVYPNIDVRYYSDNGRLKYDIIVNPGGDVNSIAMHYEGADKLKIKNKELVIKTSVGEVRELYPYSFQFDRINGKQETACSYELTDKNTVRFKVANYSKNSTLVIDPTLIFSSFTGSRADQWAYTATPGPDGSLYSAGIVFDNGFPVSTGAYKTYHSNPSRSGSYVGIDVGIMKFSPNGTQRLYATYLGGGNNEFPHSLFCDAQGNLVAMGRTYSSDFPGKLEGSGGGCDIFVTKFNAAGTALLGSLRIGGSNNDGVNIEDQMNAWSASAHRTISLLRNYGDDSHSEVVLDAAGYIYVAAQTQSDNFPMRGNGFQKTRAGLQDGAVLKIDPTCNNVIWSSYLGGTGEDAAFVLALNPSTQEIYVAGGTSSDKFPGITGNAIKQTLTSIDGFVAVISNDGTTLQRSTYIGTDDIDLLYGIQFDRFGYPYVLGVTRGTWTPKNVTYFNSNSNQFVAKLQPDLSDIIYSTTFGSGAGKPNISPVAFLVDRCENIYVSGWGGWYSPNKDPYNLAGTVGMPITNDAIKSITDGRDFYFIVLKRNSSALLYATFFGQDGGLGEHVDGGTSRFDANGVIYQAICANCGGNNDNQLPITKNYPTTPGAYSRVNGALPGGCNLAALKIAFNFAGVGSGPKAYFKGLTDTMGCIPYALTFKDTILNAKSYIWNFGDGSPDIATTSYNVSHTYENVGTYRIRLIAIDSLACNIADTAYVTIHARNDPANLALMVEKLPPCQSLLYEFTNQTTFPPGKPFRESSFTWDFGDGTVITPGAQTIRHTYAAAGTYVAKLLLNDTSYCNSPDEIDTTLRVSPYVVARFETPPYGCAPYTAVFNNTSLAGKEFHWDFGDGTTSTSVDPVHDYPNIGTYHITLIVIDSSTCNISDTTEMNLNVYAKPTANFSWSPVPPRINTPTIFTNLSTGAVKYDWIFGDGEAVSKTTMDTVSYQYNATGTFNACLIATNEWGCTDTACKAVDALIDPLLDVPNAFTPGRFGRNGYVGVTGFGIAKMTWKIYNRWGQPVFETNNRHASWDGTYKGQLQPMDVYAYTLDVEFFDGKKLRKTGDITLIR